MGDPYYISQAELSHLTWGDQGVWEIDAGALVFWVELNSLVWRVDRVLSGGIGASEIVWLETVELGRPLDIELRAHDGSLSRLVGPVVRAIRFVRPTTELSYRGQGIVVVPVRGHSWGDFAAHTIGRPDHWTMGDSREEAIKGAQLTVDDTLDRQRRQAGEPVSAGYAEAAKAALQMSALEADTLRRVRSAFPNTRSQARFDWLGTQHLDLFIPELRVAIEVQGEQHRQPVKLFGGADAFKAQLRRDAMKKTACDREGIELILVWKETDVDALIARLHERLQA